MNRLLLFRAQFIFAARCVQFALQRRISSVFMHHRSDPITPQPYCVRVNNSISFCKAIHIENVHGDIVENRKFDFHGSYLRTVVQNDQRTTAKVRKIYFQFCRFTFCTSNYM